LHQRNSRKVLEKVERERTCQVQGEDWFAYMKNVDVFGRKI
jgi:hypothetical protein